MSREWRTTSILWAATRKRGRGLVVLVNPEDLQVLAVEGTDTIQTMQGFFADHAHAVVGTGDSLEDAIQKAESYLACWEDGNLPKPENCGCGEIDAEFLPGGPRAAKPPYIVSNKRCPECKAKPRHLCKSGCQGRIRAEGKGASHG